MSEFFTWVGIMVFGVYVLALLIPIHAGSAQFWVSMYTDMKRWRQRRRDNKADVR